MLAGSRGWDGDGDWRRRWRDGVEGNKNKNKKL